MEKHNNQRDLDQPQTLKPSQHSDIFQLETVNQRIQYQNLQR